MFHGSKAPRLQCDVGQSRTKQVPGLGLSGSKMLEVYRLESKVDPGRHCKVGFRVAPRLHGSKFGSRSWTCSAPR